MGAFYELFYTHKIPSISSHLCSDYKNLEPEFNQIFEFIECFSLLLLSDIQPKFLQHQGATWGRSLRLDDLQRSFPTSNTPGFNGLKMKSFLSPPNALLMSWISR